MLTKKETLILLLLAAVNFTHIVDFMVLMPLQPQLESIFTMNPQQWSIVVSCYSFAAFVSGLLCVFFIDKIDRKQFLLWAYLGFIVGTLLCGFSNTYNQLVLTRTLTGVFGGLISSAILAMVGDLIVYEKRGRAMGIIMMGFSSAAALGVPIGIYLGNSYSWRFPFIAIGVVSLLLLILGTLSIPSLRAHIQAQTFKQTKASIVEIFTQSQSLIALLFYFVLIFSQFLLIPFLTPFLVKNIGFSNHNVMLMYLLGGLSTVITAPIIGKISDKFTHKTTFIYLLLLSLIPLYAISHLNTSHFLLAYVSTTLFFVLVSGRIIPSMAILVSVANPSIRGMYMSFRSSVQQLASALAAFTTGNIVYESLNGTYQNYDTIGLIAIGTSLSTLLLIRLLK